MRENRPTDPYTISFGEQFLPALWKSPEAILNSINGSLFARLQRCAKLVDGSSIRKFPGSAGLWMYHVADDYQLIYAVKRRTVTLLTLLQHKDAHPGRSGRNAGDEEIYWLEQDVHVPAETRARVIPTAEDMLALIQGSKSITDFRLRLDAKQQKILSAFAAKRPHGPWMIRGAPGAGKSTLALYCASDLVNCRQDTSTGERRPRVLFVTYTNSLIRVSQKLLAALVPDAAASKLEIATVHSIARRVVARHQEVRQIASGPTLHHVVTHLLAQPRQDGTRWLFSAADVDFIVMEIERWILGHGIANQESYLVIPRHGRKRGLDRSHRLQMWDLFEQLQAKLRNIYQFIGFEDLMQRALSIAKAEYDHVFIDEAQDLTPNAIRFCVALAKSPQGIYLTADMNQTIYGRSVSWKSISTSISRPRRVTLRTNYRCTREIWTAISEISKGIADDEVTLTSESMFRGPKPILQFCADQESTLRCMVAFIRQSLAEARLPPGAVAVLVKDSKRGTELVKLLPADLDPMFVRSRDFDANHRGILITTIHAAKGLEFPIVVVPDVDEGVFPVHIPDEGVGASEEQCDHDLRLLHVACSRASRSLLLLASKAKASRFVQNTTSTNWDKRSGEGASASSATDAVIAQRFRVRFKARNKETGREHEIYFESEASAQSYLASMTQFYVDARIELVSADPRRQKPYAASAQGQAGELSFSEFEDLGDLS